ncbi:hypothetical protein GMO_21650 [Gluconobacter morbifer G707]|uniref:Uncharacterized protein n=1 Tax=Gluconobacter morbifer G707 TaxID=1088869 RepID=G6XKZ9_9PROT|nr:hypothetical protein GMO_21650 [Gluconobacter morbifer G707]
MCLEANSHRRWSKALLFAASRGGANKRLTHDLLTSKSCFTCPSGNKIPVCFTFERD